jgi:hypothetical protein
MKGIGVGRKYRQIFSFTSIYTLLGVVLTAGTLLTGSCTKINEFTIGKDFVESQTKLQIIDTFKVDLYTVLLDSLVTSSAKVAFVGGFKDDTFGSVKCESYFDLAFESFSEISEDAIFDSAAFVLGLSGYSYGDTTSLMTISIHKLTEKITPFDNGYLYNNTSFDYEPEATGTLTFYPEPNSRDTTISIPVNDLGEELFALILNKDEKVSSAEWFSDYLKGFVFTSGTAENNAVIAITADQSHIILKLYYHLDLEEPEKKEISITMGGANHQFNNIVNDLTGTPIFRIKQEGNIISSREADNRGFMQGLTGFLPKIQFPYLGNILMEERWKILKAELVIKPAKGTYDIFSLPKSLYVYDTDRENRIKSVLVDGEGKPLIAAFEFDEFYDETTHYTFDITNFLNNELSDAIFDYEHGLLIGLEQDEFRSTLDRLVIEGKNPPVKLRIYYLTY